MASTLVSGQSLRTKAGWDGISTEHGQGLGKWTNSRIDVPNLSQHNTLSRDLCVALAFDRSKLGQEVWALQTTEVPNTGLRCGKIAVKVLQSDENNNITSEYLNEDGVEFPDHLCTSNCSDRPHQNGRSLKGQKDTSASDSDI